MEQRKNIFRFFVERSMVSSGLTMLEKLRCFGYTIPFFCYHWLLCIAGNCRMCLIGISGLDRYEISCNKWKSVEEVEDLLAIVECFGILRLRFKISEFLLLNHPLDCFVCDQSGECDLQDIVMVTKENSFSKSFLKRDFINVVDYFIIRTVMTRCIHCTRCVRFVEEYTEIKSFGMVSRGLHFLIGCFFNSFFETDLFLGTVVDLCPVGALNSRFSEFFGRPWECELIRARIGNECSILWNVLIESFENGILKLHACIDDRRKKSEFILDSIKNDFFFLFLQRKNKIKINFWLRNRRVSCFISTVFSFFFCYYYKVEQKRLVLGSSEDSFSLFNFQNNEGMF
jgi:NADH-quinone oxidoreductase subunit G